MPRAKKPPAPTPGPVVCRPVGEMALYEVRDIPGHAVNRLALKGVVTLAHLGERVERVKGCDAPEALRTVLGALGLAGDDRGRTAAAIEAHLVVDPMRGATRAEPDPGEAAPDGCPGADAGGVGGGPGGDPPGADPGPGSGGGPGRGVRPEGPRAGAGVPPVVVADDFDERTPPPRRRPGGDPLPRDVVLPPGESLVGAFWSWERAGRIPESAVLLKWVGTLLDPGRSGYRVAAPPMAGPEGRRLALGAAGDEVPPAAIAPYRLYGTARVTGEASTYAIFYPAD